MNPTRRRLIERVPILIALAIGTTTLAALTVVSMVLDGGQWQRLFQLFGFLGMTVIFTVSAFRFGRARRAERQASRENDETPPASTL